MVRFVNDDDICAVLRRLPAEPKSRLGRVRLRSSAATRVLGYVTARGRRDIVLACRLPPRVSLRQFMYGGHFAVDYGAPNRGQWPPWAVKRYLLFGVLLHELGHLQAVKPDVGQKRGFAGETKADEFALKWRDALWAKGCDERDPAYHAPSEGEIEFLVAWQCMDKGSRKHLVDIVLSAPHGQSLDLSFVPPCSSAARRFLESALANRI